MYLLMHIRLSLFIFCLFFIYNHLLFLSPIFFLRFSFCYSLLFLSLQHCFSSLLICCCVQYMSSSISPVILWSPMLSSAHQHSPSQQHSLSSTHPLCSLPLLHNRLTQITHCRVESELCVLALLFFSRVSIQFFIHFEFLFYLFIFSFMGSLRKGHRLHVIL